jgi:hypothetical protein
MTRGGTCFHCGKFFDNNDDLIEHELQCKQDKQGKPCRYCGKIFYTTDDLIEHQLHCGDK